MKRWQGLGGLGLGLVVLGCGGLSTDTDGAAPMPPLVDDDPPADAPAALGAPNILLIVADDLGTDKVAAYGEHPLPPATPRIDALAADGVLFENAYSYSHSSPGLGALLTGRYGRRTGIGGAFRRGATDELSLNEITIAEMLSFSPQTWSTAALGSWQLASAGSASGAAHPNAQGFSTFKGTIGHLDPAATGEKRGGYYESQIVVNGEVEWARGYATSRTTDDAIEQLNRLQAPWLLFVAYHAPHEPLHTPPEELRVRELSADSSEADRVDAAVEALDAEVGRLLDAMSPRQRKETVVMFMGDNGTARAAVRAPWDPDRAKNSLYEGGTNVPLIVRGPGVAAGERTAALTHVVDVFPTVAELATVNTHRLQRDGMELDLDGFSLRGVLGDPSSAGPRDFVYTEQFSPTGDGPYDVDWRAVRDDRFKLLDVGGRRLSFFDLSGRTDDGDALRKAQLTPAEAERYEVLLTELDRIQTELP